jgi:hypothetical protein
MPYRMYGVCKKNLKFVGGSRLDKISPAFSSWRSPCVPAGPPGHSSCLVKSFGGQVHVYIQSSRSPRAAGILRASRSILTYKASSPAAGLVALGLFAHPQWLVRWRCEALAGADAPFPSHCFAFFFLCAVSSPLHPKLGFKER